MIIEQDNLCYFILTLVYQKRFKRAINIISQLNEAIFDAVNNFHCSGSSGSEIFFEVANELILVQKKVK